MKIKIKKGLDIKLSGRVDDSAPICKEPGSCAIFPDDYPGLSPKLDVKEGDSVKVGTPILHDKTYTELWITSPVSGKVKAIVRGERRKILRIELENDGLYESETFDHKGSYLGLLLRSGIFAQIRRRPYDAVARPDARPRDIFVTALDTAPLATSATERAACLAKRAGVDLQSALSAAAAALATLTEGNVYISTGSESPLGTIDPAVMVEVCGPHPAGNVGIQIANIKPVNKGEEVWTLDIVTLYRIGHLLLTGKPDPHVLVAVTGPEVEHTGMIFTTEGAQIDTMIDGRLKNDGRKKRIISGNVLTGTAVGTDSFLHYPWRQITVIAEGNDVDEFMGWASMSPSKLSAGRTFPLSRFRRVFSPDARVNGSVRAMIMSGEYDRVLPADIMLEFLLKAILSRNLEEMEALGIYEIAPEDVALCEFVDTSKLPVQQIVRDGLDFMRKESE